jgi:hypothetical protein
LIDMFITVIVLKISIQSLATVSSKQAFKRVAKDNGVSEEGIEGTLKKVSIAEAALAATSVASLAKHFAKKAASSKVTQFVTAGATRMIWGPDSNNAEADVKGIVEEGPDFEHGQTQRVFGVYMGFSTVHFVIREKRNEEGMLVTELWDEDKNSVIN